MSVNSITMRSNLGESTRFPRSNSPSSPRPVNRMDTAVLWSLKQTMVLVGETATGAQAVRAFASPDRSQAPPVSFPSGNRLL